MMIYTHAAAGIAGAILAGVLAWQVQAWRWGAHEADRLQAEQTAREARESDARQQRRFADQAAARHAATLAQLNAQLGDARAHIARLSDRPCLSAGTVRMLNNLGAAPGGIGLRTPASQPAGAPPAAATAQADAPASGYASEQDTADWIATCKVRHDELASQINQILDIDDRRQQAAQ